MAAHAGKSQSKFYVEQDTESHGSGKSSLLQAFFGLVSIIDGKLLLDGGDISGVPNDVLQAQIVGQSQEFIPLQTATLQEDLDYDARYTYETLKSLIPQL